MDEDLIMHPRQHSSQLSVPARTTSHIWQPTQWAAHLSPKNLLCPSPLAGRAGRCVSLPGQPSAHPWCLFRHQFNKVSGHVSNLTAPTVNGMHSQPEAQDMSKRPAQQSWQHDRDLWLPSGRAPLLFALAHTTLCPASSSLCHLW